MQLMTGLMALLRPETAALPSRPDRRPETRPQTLPATGREAGGGIRTRAAPVYIASILAGAISASAWLVPGTGFSAILGWISAVLLVYVVRSRRALLPAYCAGLVGHLIGFYWVYRTVCVFGGFGPLAAASLFTLFIALGAVLFLVFALIHHQLGPVFDSWALRSATAIVLAELLTLRLFPWHFGHTQIAFTPFVQVAGLGGAMAVSFLLFWMAEVVVRFAAFGERRKAFLLPLAVVGIAIGYGVVMMGRFGSPRGEAQEVVLVQGNAALAEKRDLESARRNLTRLYQMSCQAGGPGSLIVWPEGSIPAYLPAFLATVGDPPVLPWIGNGSAFLVGSYSCTPNQERFNAAYAVYPDGEVPLPYFKRILIPFGESMPFASYLPWLRRLNARAGVFSAGTETTLFTYPMRRPDDTAYRVKVSPLICYEDTVPALAREATCQGAELLVNLTSDSWFGRSLAPYQHHLIATFRAIENRRYLVRATNTGLSAVVDPLGRTIASIPPFAEGTTTARVTPLTYRSAYSHWVGDRPWWALLGLGVLGMVRRRWVPEARGKTDSTVECRPPRARQFFAGKRRAQVTSGPIAPI